MANSESKKFTEQIEVAGEQLVGKINELVREGNARRVIIKDHNNKELMSVPMNWGVAGAGLVALAAPGLAAIGAVAALVTKVKLEVERTGDAPNVVPSDVTTTAQASTADDATKADPENPTGHA